LTAPANSGRISAAYKKRQRVEHSILYQLFRYFADSADKTVIITGSVSLILGSVLAVYYHRARALLDEMWAVDTYTSRELRRMCSGDFHATVEVQGKVSCDAPLTSPAANIECCWHHTRVDRQKRNSKGETSWEKVFEQTRSTVFKVNDGTGYTLVDPEKAEIDSVKVCNRTSVLAEPWFEGNLFFGGGLYRIYEEAFLPGGYVYVLGQASPVQQGASPDVVIHYPDKGYTEPDHRIFLVSRKPEKLLTSEQGISLSVCFWLAILAFGLAGYCTLSLSGILP
jgi:hypothetical protein